MSPGKPSWLQEQYQFLGRTSRILRENTDNFTNKWVPLIGTIADSIWVNKWPSENKTIYTIYSTRPPGYRGPLFEITPRKQFHFVDIWHHRLLSPMEKNGKTFIEASVDAFNASDLGTNNEGAVDCIAELPVLIAATRNGDTISISTHSNGTDLEIWAGTPSYDKQPVKLQPGRHKLSISKLFDQFEGDLVIRLMDKRMLLDETIVHVPAGESRRISGVTTIFNDKPGSTMVMIPSGKFLFKATNGDAFISYPVQDVDSSFNMPSFMMDRISSYQC